jgi:hypothetical protein
MKGKPEAIPIRLESPLVAQSFLAVHSKDWPWSSWSQYEKGENGLIAIDFASAERNERADSAGISVGLVRANQIANGIANGRFVLK